MSLLKFTAKRIVTMFVVLIAVVLITAVVVSLNIEMSLEERCSQEAHAKISENPDQCKGYSSMEECIDEIVKQICGT